ncbi:MAG TPA: copper chaperone PCu(A)C [Burkholderiales bacterium]|nr:copper chaperone PCu(A)C [Burkholderiales bacterium]
MKPVLAFAAMLFLSHPAFAQVEVKDPWVRATVPHQQASGAFMRLESAKDTRLVEVRSPVAGAVELHESTMKDNVMRMQKVPGVPVPAAGGAELKPGGYHVMLLRLKQQLKEGERVPLTLIFEDAQGKREAVEVSAPVRPLATAPAHGH